MTETPQSLRRLLALGLSGGVLLGVNRLMGFVLTVMLARLMSQGDYGIYTVSIAAAALIALPLSTGLTALTIREGRLLGQAADWGRFRGLLGGGLALIAVVSVLTCVAALSLAAGGPDWTATLTLWAVLLVPVTGLNRWATSLLRALDRPMLALALMNLVARSAMIAGAALIWAGGLDAGPVLIVAVHLAAEAALLLAALIALARVLPPEWRSGELTHDARSWAADILPLTLAHGFPAIHGTLGLFALGLFWPAEEASVFRIALLMMLVAETGTFLASGLNTHRFARETPDIVTADYRAAVQDTTRLAMLLSVPAVALLILFGRDVLTVVFGSEYAAAYVPMLILLCGQVFNVMTGPAAQMLSMGRQSRTVAGASIAGAAIYAAAALALAPAFGAAGAAIGATAGIAAFKTLLVVRCRRRLGADPTAMGLATRLGRSAQESGSARASAGLR